MTLKLIDILTWHTWQALISSIVTCASFYMCGTKYPSLNIHIRIHIVELIWNIYYVLHYLDIHKVVVGSLELNICDTDSFWASYSIEFIYFIVQYSVCILKCSWHKLAETLSPSPIGLEGRSVIAFKGANFTRLRLNRDPKPGVSDSRNQLIDFQGGSKVEGSWSLGQSKELSIL